MTPPLPWLSPEGPVRDFPPSQTALKEPNGLLALGGDLSPQRLLQAYALGIFPWFNAGEPILWWSPDPRCILAPGQLHIGRSFRRTLDRADYAVTLDEAFDRVLDHCAATRRGQRGTWLTAPMRRAYDQLHRLGYAHSVEVWREGALMGGLYGVSLGRAFFGESMFSRAPDGSKIALAWLCRQFRSWSFDLIDCQIASPHLEGLGAVTVSRDHFEGLLRTALAGPGWAGAWRFDVEVPHSALHRTGETAE